MEIRIKKEKEFTKGLLSGKNVKLKLSIGVVLSEEEMTLVKKYHDPFIRIISDIQPRYDGTEESFKTVEIGPIVSDLSKFSLFAHVDDGFHFFGNMQEVEKAVIGALNYALDYLKSLEAWEGEEVVTL